MKKLFFLLFAVLMVGSLAACSTMKPMDGEKIKCPACGTEFNYTPPNELR